VKTPPGHTKGSWNHAWVEFNTRVSGQNLRETVVFTARDRQ
jgi:hypothetical protein